MRIQLTGDVRVDGVRVPGGQAQLALAYLCARRTASRQEIADVLWEGRLPSAWDVALRGIVRKLRAVFAEAGADPMAMLRQTGAGYALVLGPETTVDVDEPAHADAEVVRRICSRAFLPGVEGAWVDARRAELRSALVDALERIGTVEAAGEAVLLEPFRESAHRALMAAHAAAGNRAEALRAYERCRDLLATELGADPSPPTDLLHVRLLRDDAPLPRPLQAGPTAFVGRSDELGVLLDAWRRARSGRLEVALVAGEPGIGKTRLCAALAAAVHADGARVLYGRCDPEPFDAYQPFAEALAGIARFGPSGDEDRYALFESVRTSLVRSGPVLLVLDDLHWADRASLALLRHVVRSTSNAALLVVGTFRRPEASASPHVSETLGGLRAAVVELHGLAPAEVDALIASWAGHRAPHEVASAVHVRTAGNPFFVEEFLRLVASRLGLEEGLAGADVDAIDVPERIREVIGERVRRLGREAGTVLAAASVLGVEFDETVLAKVCGVDPLDALESASASRLVHELDAGRFAFGHALVRDALYAGLTSTRRRRLHRLAGEALSGPPAAVAHHMLAARDDRAGRWCAEAGDAAAARLAYEEAAAWYEHALASATGRDRSRLLLEIGDARWRAGDLRDAKDAYLQAASEARALHEPALLVRAALAAGPAANTEGTSDRVVVRLLEEALDVPVEPAVRVRLLARLAQELSCDAAPERKASLCDEAVAIARDIGDASVAAYALNSRRHALFGIDDRPPADEIIALAVEADDRHMELEGRNWRVIELLEAGDLDAAAREVDEHEARAGELRQRFYHRFAPRFRAAIAGARGDHDAAERFAAEAYAIERDVHPEEAAEHADARVLAERWTQGRIAEMADAVDRWTSCGRRLHHWTAARVLLDTIGGRSPRITTPAPDLYARFALVLLADAAMFTGDASALEAIRDALRPAAGCTVVVGYGLACAGPVDRWL